MRSWNTAVWMLAAALASPAQVLILHKGDDSLGVYDEATGKLEQKIPTGSKPHEFTVSADERVAFVSNYGVDSWTEERQGGNTLSVIDLAARKPAGEIPLGQYHRPHGIHLGRSGRLYVTCDFPPALAVLDSRRRKLLYAIPVSGKLPHMVAVTPDERQAWTADSGSGTVSVIDLRARRQRASIDVGGVPMGIALTPDGKTLLVGTRTTNQVVVVDAVTNTVRRKLGVAGQPSRVVVSPDGRPVPLTCGIELPSAGPLASAAGADVLTGGAGADTFGSANNFGATGESVVASANTLTAGGIVAGNTITFATGAPGTVDRIIDFVSGTDKLDVVTATTAPTNLVGVAVADSNAVNTTYVAYGSYAAGTGVFTVAAAWTAATPDAVVYVGDGALTAANTTGYVVLTGLNQALVAADFV